MVLSDTSIDVKHCIPMIAAVGSVLSSLPLSDLTAPLESLTAAHVDTLQRLATQQVSSYLNNMVEQIVKIKSAFSIINFCTWEILFFPG